MPLIVHTNESLKDGNHPGPFTRSVRGLARTLQNAAVFQGSEHKTGSSKEILLVLGIQHLVVSIRPAQVLYIKVPSCHQWSKLLNLELAKIFTQTICSVNQSYSALGTPFYFLGYLFWPGQGDGRILY